MVKRFFLGLIVMCPAGLQAPASALRPTRAPKSASPGATAVWCRRSPEVGPAREHCQDQCRPDPGSIAPRPDGCKARARTGVTRGPGHAVASWAHMGWIGRASQLDFESQSLFVQSVTSGQTRQLGNWAVPGLKVEQPDERSHGQQLCNAGPLACLHTGPLIRPFFIIFLGSTQFPNWAGLDFISS